MKAFREQQGQMVKYRGPNKEAGQNMKCFWIRELGKRFRWNSLLEFVRQLFNITVYQCKEMHEMHLVTVVRLKVGDSLELLIFRDWSRDGDSINSLRYLAWQIVSGFSMRLLTIQSLVLKLMQHGLPANKPAPGVDWRTAPQQHIGKIHEQLKFFPEAE